MNDNLTDISIVLDRSGSMESTRSDTIGGFNTFLKAQKEAEGDAILTLAQFDHQYEIVHNGVKIKDVPELDMRTYVPRGMTALLDAIGRTINETGLRLDSLAEKDKPGKIIFVIITDGYENASSEFTREKINEMIKHQTDKYNWDFVFLGANQDAIAVGKSYGFMAGNSMSYAQTARGATAMFTSVAENTTKYREGDLSKKSAFFTEKDRTEQQNAGA